MPTTRLASEKAPPITWPSLSDLASQMYGEVRGLDTLGREVRRLRVQTRKIGRELRVEPRGAARVLEARGLTPYQASELVARAVKTRSRRVPSLKTSARTTTERRIDPYAAMSPSLTAAIQDYEQRTFGSSPATLLRSGVPTEIKSTDDLVRAVGGAA